LVLSLLKFSSIQLFQNVEYSKDFIDRLHKGDRIAQRTLYEAFSAKMYGVCLRYVANFDIAQDVLHDGFVKVFTSIKTFRNEGSFEGWVRRIIVNTALEYLRQRKDYLEVDIEVAKGREVESKTLDHDYSVFLKVVNDLPPQYRAVFNLYAIDEYSHNEIAEMLNISESTSKSNYSRARVILRSKLEKMADFKYEEYLQK
jgi:RNA polymerase sigma factor (sigma-70 family)